MSISSAKGVHYLPKTDSTKVHVGEPMSFIGVTDRDVGEKVPARKEMT